MSGVFDDILSRVDRLNSTANVHDLAFGQKRPVATISDDLRSIFRSTEHLLKKKSVSSNSQNILFGDRGLVLRTAPPTLEASTKQGADKGGIAQEDAQFDAEVEERLRLQVERAFFNQTLLNSPVPSLRAPRRADKENVGSTRPTQPFIATTEETTRREIMFGDRINKYIKGGKKKELSSMLMEVVKEDDIHDDLSTAWLYMSSVYGERITGQGEPAKSIQLVERATSVLEDVFIEHMKDCVNRSLEMAQLGGIPGPKALISAYLKVQGSEGHSQWEMVYHALRAGELTTAKETVSFISNCPQAAVLVTAMTELATRPRLSDERKSKLAAEWRHERNNVVDIHQRALYAALLGNEPEGAQNLEEWLWCKLSSLRFDPHPSHTLYMELQKTIAVELGESYFMPSGDVSQWLHFFTVLSLTGQPERAVKVMLDVMGPCEAVHMALVVFESKLLRTSDVADHLVVVDSSLPTNCRLNIVRLVNVYTKSFELNDVPRSLDYWYFLKGMSTPARGDIFEAAVSRAVYLTGEDALILGKRTIEGERTRALIDDYDVDVERVIEKVAEDSLIGGAPSDSIRLFILGSNINRALEVSCDRLSSSIRTHTNLNEVVEEAKSLFFLSNERPDGVSASSQSCLCMLLDTVGVLRCCEQGTFREVLRVLRQVKLLPTDADSLSASLSNLHLIPDKVREVLPDLCVGVTEMVVNQLKNVSSDAEISILKKLAEAVFLFSASVPHKFPSHINTKLLEMQTQLV